MNSLFSKLMCPHAFAPLYTAKAPPKPLRNRVATSVAREALLMS